VQLYINKMLKTPNLCVVSRRLYVKTAYNVVLKGLSATAERYIGYFNFVFLFAFAQIREVRIRTVIISRLQEEIRRTGLIIKCRVDIRGIAMNL
jgi:hypothetical protein